MVTTLGQNTIRKLGGSVSWPYGPTILVEYERIISIH